MNKLTITHFKDGDLTPMVSVPLTNVNESAILYQDDFDLLMSLGLDARWRLNANLVIARGNGQIPVARVIADSKKGEKVQYEDGNPLNLRRENLLTVTGGGKSSARDKLNKRPDILQKKITIDHIHIKPSWEEENNL